MIAWGPARTISPSPARRSPPHRPRSVPRMPATRLPIIGYPLARTALEGVLRTALAEAGSPIEIEQREARPHQLADALREVRDGEDFAGALIASPHKEKAPQLSDWLSDDARHERRGQRPGPHRRAAARLQLRPRRGARRADLDPATREGPMAAQRGRPRRRRRRASGRGGAHRRGLPARRRLQPPPSSRGGAGQPLRSGGTPHGAPGAALARRDHRGRAGSGRGARSTPAASASRRASHRSPRS